MIYITKFERIRVNIMIGADAMVKCLENEGVTTVYGYPGVAIAHFITAFSIQTYNQYL